MPALTQPAVPSGRRVRLSPLRSSKLYISFSTMSVTRHRPLEELGRLEQRQPDLLVAVAPITRPISRSSHCQSGV